MTRDTRFPLTLNASGDILFVPAGKIHARCELNLRFFPFDYQLCKYRFESWAYAAELVRITGLKFTIEPEHYMQNPEWTIPNAFVRTEIIHVSRISFILSFYLPIIINFHFISVRKLQLFKSRFHDVVETEESFFHNLYNFSMFGLVPVATHVTRFTIH